MPPATCRQFLFELVWVSEISIYVLVFLYSYYTNSMATISFKGHVYHYAAAIYHHSSVQILPHLLQIKPPGFVFS